MLRTNRTDVRKAFGAVEKPQTGCGHLQNKGNLLAVKFHDQLDIHMLSSIHGVTLGVTDRIDRRKQETGVKPTCIINYVKKMRRVDLSDQIV